MASAPDILQRAAAHIADRAATRDLPQGERSMARTVAAFTALTGKSLTEAEGWLFMVCLKAARATAGGYNPDDAEDGAAYFALFGEAQGAATILPGVLGEPIVRRIDPFPPGTQIFRDGGAK